MNYEVRNNLLESENQLYKSELKARLDKIKELEEENRRLSEKNKIYSNALVQEKENNKKLKDIIGEIVYLYKEEPTELEEYVKSGFKGGMSN